MAQAPSQTDAGHELALARNVQALTDLFSGPSGAAAPWWTGHEMTLAAMGGTPTDHHVQTHHDLVV